MPLASYFENISEKLDEAQSIFREEIALLRARLSNSDLMDREAIGADITAFKKRLTRFLDELEIRSQKVFADAAEKLRDRNVNLAALMNKREGQLAEARDKRDDAISKRDVTRKTSAKIVGERDDAVRENKKLRSENEALKQKIAEQDAWTKATKDIKRR